MFGTRIINQFILGIMLAVSLPALGMAQVSVQISANVAPPDLPVYDQPPIPADGYLWTPGYWAWSDQDGDYFWVPGTWVAPPQVGFLWTPGFWVADGAVFVWRAGYWGPRWVSMVASTTATVMAVAVTKAVIGRAAIFITTVRSTTSAM